MAIADMFLKVQGATGEAQDAAHKGEIEVVSWSWGMQGPPASVNAGAARGRSTMSELQVVKRVDQSTTTLMNFLRNHRQIGQVLLTVRKAGQTPLEYFTVALEDAFLTSLKTESEGADLLEYLSFAFARVTVTYTPQGTTGGRGGGSSEFQADAHAGS